MFGNYGAVPCSLESIYFADDLWENTLNAIYLDKNMPRSESWFRPGQSGNVHGRTRRVAEAQVAAGASYADFVDIMRECLAMEVDLLEIWAHNPARTVLERSIGKQALAMAAGNRDAFELLTHRMFGKPRDQPEEDNHNHQAFLDGIPTAVLSKLAKDHKDSVSLMRISQRTEVSE